MSDVNENEAVLTKINEAQLYALGDAYADALLDETDVLLDEYAELEIPESLDDRIAAFSGRLSRKAARAARLRSVSKIGRRAAVVAVTLLLVTAAVTFSVEAFRIKFLNMIIEVSERFSSVRLEPTSPFDGTAALPNDWNAFYPAVIPEGFSFKRASSSAAIKNIIFENGKGSELRFSQSPASAELQLDTEGAEVSAVTINGMEGIISLKDGCTILVWHDDSFIFHLDGPADRAAMIKTAESVRKK